MGIRTPHVSEHHESEYLGGFRQFRGHGANWREGGRGVFWTMDFPRSDRHFALAIRRLTRLHVRSVEQPINLDDSDQYNWPWLYAVEVGHWDLTDAQAKLLRGYLSHGAGSYSALGGLLSIIRGWEP